MTLRIGTIGSKNQLTGPTGYLHKQGRLLGLLALDAKVEGRSRCTRSRTAPT